MADTNRPVESDRHSYRTPGWVKVLGVTTLIVVLLLVVLLLTRGAGGHGPQRHFSSDEAGSPFLPELVSVNPARAVGFA